MTEKSPEFHQFQRAMPVLEVSDLPRSIAFYRDKLGFHAAIWGEPPEFAIMQRGTVTIALDASYERKTVKNQYWAAYIYVADVDALCNEYKTLDLPIHRDIENTHYGCRDFDIADPDGYLLAFGQVMGPVEFGPGLGPNAGRDSLSEPGSET